MLKLHHVCLFLVAAKNLKKDSSSGYKKASPAQKKAKIGSHQAVCLKTYWPIRMKIITIGCAQISNFSNKNGFGRSFLIQNFKRISGIVRIACTIKTEEFIDKKLDFILGSDSWLFDSSSFDPKEGKGTQKVNKLFWVFQAR